VPSMVNSLVNFSNRWISVNETLVCAALHEEKRSSVKLLCADPAADTAIG